MQGTPIDQHHELIAAIGIEVGQGPEGGFASYLDTGRIDTLHQADGPVLDGYEMTKTAVVKLSHGQMLHLDAEVDSHRFRCAQLQGDY